MSVCNQAAWAATPKTSTPVVKNRGPLGHTQHLLQALFFPLWTFGNRNYSAIRTKTFCWMASNTASDSLTLIQRIAPAECNNYASATRPDRRDQVQKQLQKEIDTGLLITTSHKPTIVNALGAVPKEGSDELRLITDASRPSGASLNSYMAVNSFIFDTVDTALELVKKDYYQYKIDLRHEYRSVPIHPDDYQHCGSKWAFQSGEHTYMMDTRLCFGATKAPKIFQRITSSVTRMMQRRGFTSFVYLDDWFQLLVESPHHPGVHY